MGGFCIEGIHYFACTTLLCTCYEKYVGKPTYDISLIQRYGKSSIITFIQSQKHTIFVTFTSLFRSILISTFTSLFTFVSTFLFKFISSILTSSCSVFLFTIPHAFDFRLGKQKQFFFTILSPLSLLISPLSANLNTHAQGMRIRLRMPSSGSLLLNLHHRILLDPVASSVYLSSIVAVAIPSFTILASLQLCEIQHFLPTDTSSNIQRRLSTCDH